MLTEKLGIDHKDVKIISYFMNDPYISQTEIAEKMKMSQPSINVRVHKLKQKGILVNNIGIDVIRSGLSLVRVDCTCKNAEKTLNTMKNCSFFVNGFLMSGKRNLCLFIVGLDLRKIEAIIDKHLRSSPDITDVDMSVIVSSAKPYITDMALDNQGRHQCQDPSSCEECRINDNYINIKN